MDYITIKENIIYILTDLGFTLDKITPLIVFLLIIYLVMNKKIKPIKRIEAFIIRLCGAIETGGNIEKMELYKAESPLKITEKGMEIIEKIGFKKTIDDNLPYFFKFIDGLKPKSALDVEETCIGVIRYLITDKKKIIFNDVENFLYNNPQYNKPEYFKVAGLYLRDKYLEQNPSFLPPRDEESINQNG